MSRFWSRKVSEGINRLLRLLSECSPGVTPYDVLDAVWMTAQGEFELPTPATASTTQHLPRNEEQIPPPPGAAKLQKSTQPVQNSALEPESEEIFSDRGNSESPGRRVRIPGAAAISQSLELDRVLKPWRVRRKNPHVPEIDEEASALHLLEYRLPAIITRPKFERYWVEIVIVFERSPTMRLWQHTAAGLLNSLRRAGGAGIVSAYYCEYFSETLELVNPLGSPVPALSILRPGQNRLIIFVSDAMSFGWQQGVIQKQLFQWSACHATLVVQPLPERLWKKTSFRGERLQPTDQPRSLKTPIICELNLMSISNAVMFLAGRGGSQRKVTVLCKSRAAIEAADETDSADYSPNTSTQNAAIARYNEFEGSADSTTYRLATYLAWLPLQLPLMRLIQASFISDAAPWQLAEIFLSGMVRRCNPPVTLTREPRQLSDIDSIEYEFLPEAAAQLRRQGGLNRQYESLRLVSRYVDSQYGCGDEFVAVILGDDESADRLLVTLPEGARAIASVCRQKLMMQNSSIGTWRSARSPLYETSPKKSSLSHKTSPASTGLDAERGNRVWLSFVASEFAPLRDQVVSLLSTCGWEILSQDEAFQPAAESVLDLLANSIRHASLVIHVVGAKVGSIPTVDASRRFLAEHPDFLSDFPQLRRATGDLSNLGYHEWQYLIALEFRIPIMCYATRAATTSQVRQLSRLQLSGLHPFLFDEEAKFLSQLSDDVSSVPYGSTVLPRIAHFEPVSIASNLRDTNREILNGLDNAWANENRLPIHIVLGTAGSGKTTLINHWIFSRFVQQEWKGVDRFFHWSFSRLKADSTHNFLKAAIEFFTGLQSFKGAAVDSAEFLAAQVKRHRSLIVLEELDTLCEQPGKALDPAMQRFLRSLNPGFRGICVLTSRTDIGDIPGTSLRKWQMTRPPGQTNDNRKVEHPIVVIDGPVSSGVSTVSIRVAERLGYQFVATGTLFRMFALGIMELKADLSDGKQIREVIQATQITFSGQSLLMNGRDVASEIRSPEVTLATAKLTENHDVRKRVGEVISEISEQTAIVTGSLGTDFLLPASDCQRIYLTADPDVRARRRHNELVHSGSNVALDQIEDQLRERDRRGKQPHLAAWVLDTSDLTIEEVVDSVVDRILTSQKANAEEREASRYFDPQGPGFRIHTGRPLEELDDDALLDIACNIVTHGIPQTLSGFEYAMSGSQYVIGRLQIDSFHNIRQLIDGYVASKKTTGKPLSLAVFGPPGSGKSSAVSSLLGSNFATEFNSLNLNLSQLSSPNELGKHLQELTREAANKPPIVFFDEFDSSLGGENFGWLKYFLAPMDDGVLRTPDQSIPVNNAIFVFAGGKSTSNDLNNLTSDRTTNSAKLSDFVSRVSSTLDIPDLNASQDSDSLTILRRAIVFRTEFERCLGLSDKETIPVDRAMMSAMLQVEKFRHGARSIAAIADNMSNSLKSRQRAKAMNRDHSREGGPSKSLSLDRHVLDLHVDRAGAELLSSQYSHVESRETLFSAPNQPPQKGKADSAQEMNSTRETSPKLQLPETLSLTLSENVEIQFHLLPPGNFLMSSVGAYEDSVKRVVISQPFYLGIYPVTQEQYSLFRRNHRYGFPNRPNHPAENINWLGAVAFCDWLTQRYRRQIPTGFDAGLPSEAQWEYGCRLMNDETGSPYCVDTEYYTGDGELALADCGWFVGNSNGSPHPVGAKKPTDFGLYDLHGNVWEWCRDAVDWGSYEANRVFRGGSWRDSAKLCRAAYRRRRKPRYSSGGLGFRVCLFPSLVSSQPSNPENDDAIE